MSPIPFFVKALPWILVVVLISFRLFKTVITQPTDKKKEAIEQIKSNRDSLTNIIHAKTDTIAALRLRRQTMEFERDKANRERTILMQQHEKNKSMPVPIANDSLRHRAIAELYPSFRGQ